MTEINDFKKDVLFRGWREAIVARYFENVTQFMIKLFCSFMAVVLTKLVSQAIVSNIFAVLNFFHTLYELYASIYITSEWQKYIDSRKRKSNSFI